MKLVFAVTLSLLALVAVVPAEAGVYTTVLGVQNTYTVPYTRTDCAGCITEVANTNTYDDGVESGTTTITAYAKADYGVLKTSTSATGAGGGATASITAAAGLADQFEINAPGLSGTRGYFTAQVSMPFASSFQSSLQEIGHGGASLDFFISLNGSTAQSDFETYQLLAGNSITGLDTSATHNGSAVSPEAPIILRVPFYYGAPISINASLQASAFSALGSNGGSFSAVMDASHSMYWEGIGSVTDASGQTVTGYTLTSDSGTDWTRNFAAAPVPEPGTVLLMFAGLAAIGLRRRSEGR